MKIRYPIIAIIMLVIAIVIIGNINPLPSWSDAAFGIIFILIISCLGLTIYLIVRNIFRAIVGATKKPKEH